jgi:WD40 repeat protein
MKHDEWVMSAAFSPDGARIATVDRAGRVRLWDAASGAAAKITIDAACLSSALEPLALGCQADALPLS